MSRLDLLNLVAPFSLLVNAIIQVWQFKEVNSLLEHTEELEAWLIVTNTQRLQLGDLYKNWLKKVQQNVRRNTLCRVIILVWSIYSVLLDSRLRSLLNCFCCLDTLDCKILKELWFMRWSFLFYFIDIAFWVLIKLFRVSRQAILY